MSIRKVSFIYGEYYHIYNRGNSKQKIFHDKQDYERFIKLLFLSNSMDNFNIRDIKKNFFDFNRKEKLVAIGSYCLMPNHFHLLITQTEVGDISKFMQKLTTAYSMYYNKKYTRTGSLFEGKFKSQYINSDRYLKYLFSYIHLNPIKIIQRDWKEKGIKDKKKALDFLENYKFSSYLDFLSAGREENVILDGNYFPDYFPNEDKIKEEIFEWILFVP